MIEISEDRQDNTDVPDIVEVTVPPESAGARLDAFLAGAVADLSRSRLKSLIKGGQVTIGGATVVEPKHPVNVGDVAAVTLPQAVPPMPEGEAIPLAIVYEDDDLIVIDKPAGLVVHPAPGHHGGTLVNALIAHCGESLSGIGGVKRPGIVHRLDKDTTGLLVVAKNDRAHAGLAAEFAAHGRDGGLERHYQALVWGVPTPTRGTIEGDIGRSPTNRQKMAVTPGKGRHAVTHYVVNRTFGPAAAPIASLVTLTLETGRTHQIRVHLAKIGHPVIGDSTYGAGMATKVKKLPDDISELVAAFPRQALHAGTLGFIHPVTGEKLRFEAPLPADMAKVAEALKSLG